MWTILISNPDMAPYTTGSYDSKESAVDAAHERAKDYLDIEHDPNATEEDIVEHETVIGDVIVEFEVLNEQWYAKVQPL